jgi:hypothetical protein
MDDCHVTYVVTFGRDTAAAAAADSTAATVAISAGILRCCQCPQLLPACNHTTIAATPAWLRKRLKSLTTTSSAAAAAAAAPAVVAVRASLWPLLSCPP